MKKFISEYKALRSKSETETSKDRDKVDTAQEMGVFKWLRRERVTVTQDIISTPAAASGPDTTIVERHSQSATQIGTIRTEEYKRDLAEFQARRSLGNRELPETPVKKKTRRRSVPVSCTCTTDPDNTFSYEKKSAAKYKKKSHKSTQSMAVADSATDGLPSIQFLFQNQVFMPGNLFQKSHFSEPRKPRNESNRTVLVPVNRQLDLEDDQRETPLIYKNNSLPIDMKAFIEGDKTKEEVDGLVKDKNLSSRSSSVENVVNDSSVWEVMNELKSLDVWADEQLMSHSGCKSDDSKSDTSAYGLPVASAVNLDLDTSEHRTWLHGSWGVVPVQAKKLVGVTVEHVKKKMNTEINILRKYRHPNIILLMGLYPDVQQNVFIICERCIDSLFGIIHIQGRILSAQTSVHYTLDIANALVFLRMQGYIHTELTSHSIMVTSHDAAKLADLGPCMKLAKVKPREKKGYDVYSPEPQYVNIEDTRESTRADSEPLLSQHPSETYLIANSVSKPYTYYRESENYRWQAPELFEPDEEGLVHPCAKSDAYSLCLILWECCNATMPWKSFTYEKLKEMYLLWNTGVGLPKDGTYPGSLLALLQKGLTLNRSARIDLHELQSTLLKVKRNLDDLEYIVIPARISKKKSTFSSTAWDNSTNSPTDESDCLSPLSKNVEHKVVIHNHEESSDTSEKESKTNSSPMYESLRIDKHSGRLSIPENCFVSDEEHTEERPVLKYEHLPEKDYSSACSTPLAKVRARMRDITTPGSLHRSDSTEYCSFLSPENNFLPNDSNKQSVERPTAKLSRSFTPKSYKPLHIKVPECNLDSVKSLLKDQSDTERSMYNFDIKNYSLPTTPIARSNKLRRNAWLSGELSLEKKRDKKLEAETVQSAPETPSNNFSSANATKDAEQSERAIPNSPETIETDKDSFTGLKRVEPPSDFSPESDNLNRDGFNTWAFKNYKLRPPIKYNIEEDVLANVNVKPLVAIHERWIYEANRKTARSMSLPEEGRPSVPAVKPASHCVDTFQKSVPQANAKKNATKTFRSHPISPASSGKSGSHWEQFCVAREMVAKSINFGNRDANGIDRFRTWKRDSDKGTVIEEDICSEPKTDQSTDTQSIEDFIRDLIRKEFQHILHEIDDSASSFTKNEEIVNKGVANIVENLKNGEADETMKKENNIKSFSRVKINGNNKPLLQITFNRSGENTLQVLDKCVNVTICDNNMGKDKMNISLEDTLTGDDVQVHSLKRCQAFNAIQEARSTEDLYIDDDLSTQLQENFGGRVKLIPLHGSLHEILCEKEDDCCLIKVKQENGCDTIYFRCDNSDTESRDAIDGAPFENSRSQDTVVFKRSISLVEERIQRIFPKDKKVQTPIVCRRTKSTEVSEKARPKSEVFAQTINESAKTLSNSSPSLVTQNDDVEINIENAISYQDSSSEECIRCQLENDDFEQLEKKIEEDLAKGELNKSSMNCGYLQKISEENLSVLNDDIDATVIDTYKESDNRET